jgi:hypothetical protein
MTFHADFWVGAAATAPVIALSAVVSTGEIVKRMNDDDISNATVSALSKNLRNASYSLDIINIAVQIFVLVYSLRSLAAYKNEVSLTLTIGLIGIGMGLLVVVAILSNVTVRTRS